MARENFPGQCETCAQVFDWYLIHNGFNSSCHAYCSLCGATAILSLYSPSLMKAKVYPGGITANVETLLASCTCGGAFRANAFPRCPSCSGELSAVEASRYIETAEPGSQNGWRWQQLWTGPRALYAIIINGRQVEDPFLAQS